MDREKLEKLRHSTAHLLAAAVVDIWPNVKPTIGPAIKDGFYYDFDFGKIKITEDDLKRIKNKMKKIIPSWISFKKEEVSAGKAEKIFKNNPYKLELIADLEKNKEKITLYKSGNFVDLCQGGHTPKPNKDIKHFKLLEIAGAYWRGNEKNKMLTRIYGTVFPTKKGLDEYLERRKMAEKLNHRKLGKELELFAIFPEIGQGLPVWLPKGYKMRRILENYMINLEEKYGYKHILTPHINRAELFKTSGHLKFYKDSMYPPIEIEGQEYYLKPMNCPAAMIVYKRKPRSYRELPLKLGELGTVYRYEKSGELQGLQRVRGFTQNDAHIFCAQDQLKGQIEEVIEMLKIFYKDVGFNQYYYRLSISDWTDKEAAKKYAGKRKDWDFAENTLKEVLKKTGEKYKTALGEAVFYGPKIDVQAINVFGKEDSISTIQIDFNLPKRFKITYIDSYGSEKQPITIHRALVGSFERFFAFLIEHHKGAFPVWFSSTQVKILPISEKVLKYANKIKGELLKEGIRVEVNNRNETLSAKIRDSQNQKVPYMAIVGEKEAKENNISLRLRGGKDLGQINLNQFKKRIKEKIENKSLSL